MTPSIQPTSSTHSEETLDLQTTVVDHDKPKTSNSPQHVLTIELNPLYIINNLHHEQEIPVPDEIPDEIEFPPEYNQLIEHKACGQENTNDYYYEIGPHNTPPSNNLTFTTITNYPRDTICEEDVLNGLKKVENDEVSVHGPFTDVEFLILATESWQSEHFFNQLFDEKIFTGLEEKPIMNIRK